MTLQEELEAEAKIFYYFHIPAFKAMLQVLRGDRLKFIDVTINFRLFFIKKFAFLQLKVTCTYT